MIDDVYEVHLGFTARNLGLLLAAAVFVALGFLPGLPTYITVLDVGLFGLGGLLVTYQLARNRLALRVDWAGITLSGNRMGGPAGEHVVPWTDIVAIQLWVWRNPAATGARTPYLTVLRRDGLPALPGRANARIANVLSEGLVGIPVEQLNSSVPLSLWRLDRSRFQAAVGRYAPHVPVGISPDFPK